MSEKGLPFWSSVTAAAITLLGVFLTMKWTEASRERDRQVEFLLKQRKSVKEFIYLVWGSYENYRTRLTEFADNGSAFKEQFVNDVLEESRNIIDRRSDVDSSKVSDRLILESFRESGDDVLERQIRTQRAIYCRRIFHRYLEEIVKADLALRVEIDNECILDVSGELISELECRYDDIEKKLEEMMENNVDNLSEMIRSAAYNPRKKLNDMARIANEQLRESQKFFRRRFCIKSNNGNKASSDAKGVKVE